MPGPVPRYGGSGVADVEYRHNFNATAFDGINLTDGTLTIGQAASLDLVFNSAGSNVNWHNTFWDANQSWVFIDNVVNLQLGDANVFTTIAAIAGLGSVLAFRRRR
jgi:hypothetical protein